MTHSFDVFTGQDTHTKNAAVKMFDSHSRSGSVCLFHLKQIKIIKLIIPEYIALVGGGHGYSLIAASSGRLLEN